MKKILSIIICLLFVFSLFCMNTVSAEVPSEDETYLYSTKGGTVKKVYHYGGGEVTIPKNFTVYESEMRGVWVATVYNIAIGKQKDTSEKAIRDYKAEFLTILDRMEEYGMNTLFFQIRPSNDAFYKSELNPWSQFLVGAGIDPGWDPLEWMIEETHKRGFDFQCWMNAYRVTTESALPDNEKMASTYATSDLLKYKKEKISLLADGNFAKKHPEYVVLGEYDTRLILNPSEVAVQDFIVESLKEIVENYDIDGMHFDDYFYLNGYTSSDTRNTSFAGGETYDPTLVGENTLNDLGNYEEYLNGDPKYSHMERGYNLGEFRRENINVMMRKIRAMVDEYNEKNNDNVEFGSKPAAVWRSNSEFCDGDTVKCSPIGSDTHEGAYASYSNLFADTWKWVEEGLVDYVAPQVYYSFEDSYVPYADIVDWWAEMVENLNNTRAENQQKPIKLYIAHGIYKYRDAKDQFYNAAEIRNQIVYNKKHPTIVGSAFYSYECLYEFASDTHEKGAGYLKTNWANNQVYPIQRGEDDSAGLKVENYSISYDVLAKSHSIVFPKQEGSRVYGIYKVEKGKVFDSSDISTRINIVYDPYVEGENAVLNINDYDENYDYYIKVVSTNGHVSKESTKLDFSNVEEIESLKINYISDIPTQILAGSKLNVKASVSNISGNSLTYNVYFVQNGNIRKDRILASGVVKGNTLDVSFNIYSSSFINSALCLEITDGKISTEKCTNVFDIVERLTIPNVVSANNLFDSYTKDNNINAVLNISNPTNKEYNYSIYLVDADKLTEEKIDSGSTSESSINLNINLSTIAYENMTIKVVLSQDGKESTSSYFVKINDPLISAADISIDKTVAHVNDIINISGNVPSEYNGMVYSIDIVNEQNELIETAFVNNVYDGVISFSWYVTELNAAKVKLRITLGSDGMVTTVYSDVISIVIEKNIIFNLYGGKMDKLSMTYIQGTGVDSLPIPTKDGYVFAGWYLNGEKVDKIGTDVTGDVILNAKWEEQKSGCGCGNSASGILVFSLILSTAFIFLRKKK